MPKRCLASVAALLLLAHSPQSTQMSLLVQSSQGVMPQSEFRWNPNVMVNIWQWTCHISDRHC
jgi:hypothetical protein